MLLTIYIGIFHWGSFNVLLFGILNASGTPWSGLRVPAEAATSPSVLAVQGVYTTACLKISLREVRNNISLVKFMLAKIA